MNNIVFQAVFMVISLIGAYFSSSGVTNADLQPILGTLQNLSAAAFTLSGIWIAYMYPEAIAAFTNNKVSLISGNDNVDRIADLVIIVFVSAFVLINILFYNVAYYLFVTSEFVSNNMEVFRFLATAYILLLALNQVFAILSIMSNNIKFIDRLYRLKTEKAVNDDL